MAENGWTQGSQGRRGGGATREEKEEGAMATRKMRRGHYSQERKGGPQRSAEESRRLRSDDGREAKVNSLYYGRANSASRGRDHKCYEYSCY
jgi:hypothetical protein